MELVLVLFNLISDLMWITILLIEFAVITENLLKIQDMHGRAQSLGKMT